MGCKIKKVLKYLEVKEKLPIFAARMRVAYRRDDIKLRNRSFYTKPLVEYLRLYFLVSGRAWIKHFNGRHNFLSSLYAGIDNHSLTIEHHITGCNHPTDKVGPSA